MSTRPGWLLASLLAGSWLALAGADLARAGTGRPPEPDGFGFRLSVPAVQLYPVVRHRKGYVRQLGADDFVVLEQGRPVAIDSLDDEVCSVSVALLIDVSDSMSDKLARVKDASCRFLDRLGPEDRVQVFAFNHGIAPVSTLAAGDHEPAKAAIRALKSGGGTAIYDAVDFILDHDLLPLERNVIVLFTDGRDQTQSLATRTARRARARGVIIYTLRVPEPVFNVQSEWGIRVLSEWTGGEDHRVPAADRLNGVFDSIVEDLKAQYRLTFTPAPGPPGERRIEVKTRDTHYAVRCRESYRYEGE